MITFGSSTPAQRYSSSSAETIPLKSKVRPLILVTLQIELAVPSPPASSQSPCCCNLSASSRRSVGILRFSKFTKDSSIRPLSSDINLYHRWPVSSVPSYPRSFSVVVRCSSCKCTPGANVLVVATSRTSSFNACPLRTVTARVDLENKRTKNEEQQRKCRPLNTCLSRKF